MDAVTKDEASVRKMIGRLLQLSSEEGIVSDGPLAAWVRGQAAVLETLAGVLDRQEQQIEAAAAHLTKAGRESLQAAAIELKKAAELREAADRALTQVNNLRLVVGIERQRVVDEMVEKTLPMFAAKLQDVLRIREKRWNREIERRRFFGAAGIVLTIFLAGYGLSWWQDRITLEAAASCLEHALAKPP
jgi:hypothetical protein